MLQNQLGLTRDQIKQAAPSVYAEAAHESRSARYLFIPTSQVLDALSDVGFVPTTAMQSVARSKDRQEFTKHLLRLRRHEDLGWNKPDVHEIVLVNSHDGASSYNLYSGIFRLVCTNGLIRGDINETMKVYHKGNIVQEVVESTLEIAEESEGVMGEIAAMKETELSREEQLLLAEFAIRARYDVDGENAEEIANKRALVPYQPTDFLWPRRRADVGHDLYTTLNVVQEHALVGGSSRRDARGARHTVRKIKGIDQTVSTNRLLWQFAQKMMELKG